MTLVSSAMRASLRATIGARSSAPQGKDRSSRCAHRGVPYGTFLFLLSDAASYVTGAVLRVAGGR